MKIKKEDTTNSGKVEGWAFVCSLTIFLRIFRKKQSANYSNGKNEIYRAEQK